MIWEYVALPPVEIILPFSKSPFDSLIAIAQSNSTVYQELKAVIARYGLSFRAKSLTRNSIISFWRSITRKRPLASKIRLLRVQAAERSGYGRVGLLLHWISVQCRIHSQEPDSFITIQRLEIAISGRMWEGAASEVSNYEFLSGLKTLLSSNDLESYDWAYAGAGISVDIDFGYPQDFVSQNVANQVVLDIVDLDEKQKEMVVRQAQRWNTEVKFSADHDLGCNITLGPFRTQVTRNYYGAYITAHCYQIRFDKRPKTVLEADEVMQSIGMHEADDTIHDY